jgi:acetylornithine deacetylase/succinyl-diaminopimelate desuccinylase-like protein
LSIQFAEPDELLTHAELYREQAVEFLLDLIRIRSVNGRDPETKVAKRVQTEAEKLGLKARLIGVDEQRQNVLVELGSGERGFAFLAHMDTVSPGSPELWKGDPFDGLIIDDRLYGRGAADNKAGLVCGLFSLALLKDHQFEASGLGRVVLAGVVDEESGANSPLGVRHLLDSGNLDVDGAIYTYASEVICIGHRGLLRLRIRTQGKSVHSGSVEWDRGEDGVNAVTGLAAILLELERVDMIPAANSSFPGLNTKFTPGTLISGGDWEGMVPAWAEAIVDIRMMPDQSADSVHRLLTEIVDQALDRRPGLAVEICETTSLPGVAISKDHSLVKITERFTEQITGRKWEAIGAGPANEGYMLIDAGIPTICGFGPNGGSAHAANEWVTISSLSPTIAMYSGIARDYLAGLKE